MTHYPQCNSTHRATRIQLSTATALVKSSDGHRAKARLQVVSETGGLLQLAKALAEGDFVEVALQTQSGSIQGMAEMLNPVRWTQGSVFQAFRFIALDDEYHELLRRIVKVSADDTFRGLRSSDWASRR